MSKKSLDSLTYRLITDASKIAAKNKNLLVGPFHLLQAIVEDPEAKTFLENLDFPFKKMKRAVAAADPGYKTYEKGSKKPVISQDVFGLCRSAERFSNEISRPWAGYTELLKFLKEMGDDETERVIEKMLDLDDDYLDDLILHEWAEWTPETKIVKRSKAEFDKVANDNKKAEYDAIRNLGDALKEKVFDQDAAIDAIHNAMKLATTGMKEEDSTLGNYLFAGPTGVGKTEVAKQIAEILDMEFVRIDMSEFGEKHTVRGLIGAPPSYTGYDDGGQLTNRIEAANKAGRKVVLLLDEIEKAHPDVFNILLQVMDDARLTNGKGETIEFNNVLLIMTSNAGSREAAEATAKQKIGFGSTTEEYNEKAKEDIQDRAIRQIFSPEFRNRLDDIIKFSHLKQETIQLIAEKFIKEMHELPASSERNLSFSVSAEALVKLAEQGHDPDMGARPMKRLIKEEFRIKVSDMILDDDISDMHLEIDYDFENEKYKINSVDIASEILMLSHDADQDNDQSCDEPPPIIAEHV